MQMCRWQNIESLRTYAQLGAESYKHWLTKSFGAAFTPGTWADVNIDSSEAMFAVNDDAAWRTTLGEAADEAERPPPPRRVRQRTAAPLDAQNAARRRVLVPATRYPRHTCAEHDGEGWEAIVLSATSVSAVVRYLYARTVDGRKYEDTREPLHILQALDDS